MKYNFSRGLTIGFLFGCMLAAHAAPSLQQPPKELPKDYPKLSALLETTGGKPVESKDEWEKQREEIRKQWIAVLGGMPKKKAPLKPEFLEKETLSGFTRQYVRYQIEDGLFTDGYLLAPTDAKRAPAIVVFHPTTPLNAKGVAGLSSEYAEEKWMGIQLVKRGYVVWCPRNYINTDGADWKGNAKKVIAAHPGWTGMGRMVWDAIRAADFVETLPNVDKTRIGCIGHSLGGKEALYAPAFDERYKAAVSCEGGIGLKLSNWSDVWYLGDKITKPGFKHENHEVLSLVAPRPFLLIAGNASDNAKSWAFIEAVKPVYQLYGKPENVGWFNHGLGHRYAPEARVVAEEFLDRYLKN